MGETKKKMKKEKKNKNKRKNKKKKSYSLAFTFFTKVIQLNHSLSRHFFFLLNEENSVIE